MCQINQFIDIHTHHPKTGSNVSIVNVLVDEAFIDLAAIQKIKDNNPLFWFSAGIHPWHMDNWRHKLDNLKVVSQDGNIIAIGECGLDKKIEAPLNEQTELFQLHIALSEELQKPIIIHCVKAFNELIEIRKNTKHELPWIIHGFNSNKEIATQCLKHRMILSFGKSLLNSKSGITDVIKWLPIESIFLETDDTNLSIEELYWKCSEIRGISLDDLKSGIARNFKNYFKC